MVESGIKLPPFTLLILLAPVELFLHAALVGLYTTPYFFVMSSGEVVDVAVVRELAVVEVGVAVVRGARVGGGHGRGVVLWS